VNSDCEKHGHDWTGEAWNDFCRRCGELRKDNTEGIAPPEIRSGEWVCECAARLDAEADRLDAEYATAAASAPSLHHMAMKPVEGMFHAQHLRKAAVWLRDNSHTAEVSDGGPLTHESKQARTRRSLH
jgi:hypothetical protein